nr:protein TRIGALACTOSYLDIACYLGLYCEROL 4, chloroplastic isoform X2 [Arachis hypogaea]
MGVRGPSLETPFPLTVPLQAGSFALFNSPSSVPTPLFGFSLLSLPLLLGIWVLSLFTLSSSDLLLQPEAHGEKGRRQKLMVYHKLPEHDLTFEAAWPQLFVDHKGKYWDVPESISADLSSLVSESGIRYHIGIHKNGGNPSSVNATDGSPPLSLLPGLCAKAAATYEMSRDFWREKADSEEDIWDNKKKSTPYDSRLAEPHAAISGTMGGSCASWIWNPENIVGTDSREVNRSRFSADLFGSVCYSYQQGKFTKDFRDFTKVDARLDIPSASAFAKKVFSGFKRDVNEQAAASPRLNLIFQQQIAGPFVFRADSRVSLMSMLGKGGPIEDFICSINYSFKSLPSGKIVAWFSPKRKEGMVELRLLEF